MRRGVAVLRCCGVTVLGYFGIGGVGSQDGVGKAPLLRSPINVLGLIFLVGFLVFSLVTARVSSGPENAKVAKAKLDVATYLLAIDQFEKDCGRYPTEQEGLEALSVAPANLVGWNGPYLQAKILCDPWGNPYLYEVGPGDRFRIRSLGADDTPGGVGENADIVDGEG